MEKKDFVAKVNLAALVETLFRIDRAHTKMTNGSLPMWQRILMSILCTGTTMIFMVFFVNGSWGAIGIIVMAAVGFFYVGRQTQLALWDARARYHTTVGDDLEQASNLLRDELISAPGSSIQQINVSGKGDLLGSYLALRNQDQVIESLLPVPSVMQTQSGNLEGYCIPHRYLKGYDLKLCPTAEIQLFDEYEQRGNLSFYIGEQLVCLEIQLSLRVGGSTFEDLPNLVEAYVGWPCAQLIVEGTSVRSKDLDIVQSSLLNNALDGLQAETYLSFEEVVQATERVYGELQQRTDGWPWMMINKPKIQVVESDHSAPALILEPAEK